MAEFIARSIFTDPTYYEVRSYRQKGGGRGGSVSRTGGYWLNGRYETIQQAYLAAFNELSKHDDDGHIDPVIDIVEIEPVERQVYKVSSHSLEKLIEFDTMKQVEVEQIR